MKIRSHGAFPVLITALLAGLTFWLEQATRLPPPTEDARLRHDPDYIVEHFSVQRFDSAGHLQSSLGAVRMSHFPDDDSTMVNEPVITFSPPQVPNTRISAQQGTISGDGKRIVLTGDVVVERDAPPDGLPTTLRSPDLTVFPDDKLARTDARVRIEQGQSVLNGTGMEADHSTGQYSLKSRVDGRFLSAAGAGAAP